MLLAKDCPAVLEQVFVGLEDYGNTYKPVDCLHLHRVVN